MSSTPSLGLFHRRNLLKWWWGKEYGGAWPDGSIFTWTPIPAIGWADKAENSLGESTCLREKWGQGKQEPTFPEPQKWEPKQKLLLIDSQLL